MSITFKVQGSEFILATKKQYWNISTVCVHTYMFKSDFTVYKASLKWKAVVAHLCSCAPVEPAHIGWVSEVRVDPAGDQHMAMGLFILDDVVEVWTGRQHGRLTKAFTTQHHEQTHKAQPVQLLQLWERGDADVVYSNVGHMTGLTMCRTTSIYRSCRICRTLYVLQTWSKKQHVI